MDNYLRMRLMAALLLFGSLLAARPAAAQADSSADVKRWQLFGQIGTGFIGSRSFMGLGVDVGIQYQLGAATVQAGLCLYGHQLADEVFPRGGAGVKSESHFAVLGSGTEYIHPSASSFGFMLGIQQPLGGTRFWMEAQAAVRSDYIVEYEDHPYGGGWLSSATYHDSTRRALGAHGRLQVGYHLTGSDRYLSVSPMAGALITYLNGYPVFVNGYVGFQVSYGLGRKKQVW